MYPVDHTKAKQHLLDISRRSTRTDKIAHAMQHAQKRGYLASDGTPTKFGSTVTSFFGVNSELMDRMNYGY